MLLYILHPPLCSCRAGIPTNPFSKSLTLKVYHNFIKTFHGFVLGRVSTSPPKSCLAVPKVEITSTPKLWSMQLHKSMMILWKVDWMYFWGFKKCVQKHWDDLYLYWISSNHWTKALGTVTVNFVFQKMPTLSDSIHSHPSPLPKGWYNDPKDGWGDSRTLGGWSRDGQGQ